MPRSSRGPLVFGIRISWIIIRRMVSLTDYQLRIALWARRAGLPVEKCDIFLQRIAAMLARGYGRFTDTDVADVAQLRSPVSCRRPPRQRERRPRPLAFVDTVWTLQNKANTASGAPSNKLLRYLYLLVGAQGLEPWTR